MVQRKVYLGHDRIGTIYFGGGTPSLLGQQELGLLFDTLQKHYSIEAGAEITLECNPDDLNPQTLKMLQDLGVNRLSIGLQSFDEAELRWMNRAHTAAESEASVKRAQDKGFDNITIDLIYGSKFQTLKSWKQTLQKAIDLDVKHISAYNLTIESKTKLGHDHALHREPAVDDEKSAECFLEMMDLLEQDGFIHYEISNFGKTNYFSRHNSNYWKGLPYVGFGPSAHSFDGSSRQWNVPNNNLYMKRLADGSEGYFEREVLSDKDQFNEYILTAMRTMWGVDGAQIKTRFGEDVYRSFMKAIEPYLEKKLITNTNGLFQLSREGKLFADKIASDLFI